MRKAISNALWEELGRENKELKDDWEAEEAWKDVDEAEEAWEDVEEDGMEVLARICPACFCVGMEPGGERFIVAVSSIQADPCVLILPARYQT